MENESTSTYIKEGIGNFLVGVKVAQKIGEELNNRIEPIVDEMTHRYIVAPIWHFSVEQSRKFKMRLIYRRSSALRAA